MRIKRSCGHREEIAGTPTPEGLKYLESKVCGECWKVAREKEMLPLNDAESMPACPSFKSGAERKAADNRRHFRSAYASQVRPALWKATPEQREASRLAMMSILANTSSDWWALQTSPIQTLRDAH